MEKMRRSSSSGASAGAAHHLTMRSLPGSWYLSTRASASSGIFAPHFRHSLVVCGSRKNCTNSLLHFGQRRSMSPFAPTGVSQLTGFSGGGFLISRGNYRGCLLRLDGDALFRLRCAVAVVQRRGLGDGLERFERGLELCGALAGQRDAHIRFSLKLENFHRDFKLRTCHVGYASCFFSSSLFDGSNFLPSSTPRHAASSSPTVFGWGVFLNSFGCPIFSSSSLTSFGTFSTRPYS